jgi:recombination protein RecR
MLPKNIKTLIEELSRLPGIGPKSAERLAFYLLNRVKGQLMGLGQAIMNVKEGLQYCERCQNISENIVCVICSNESRDSRSICVVENPMDVFALEGSGAYKGLYHVLHGAISPMDGVGPDDLKIRELVGRANDPGADEVILATNPTMTGEATAAYLMRQLAGIRSAGSGQGGVRVTRLAQGLPMGGELEFADMDTLKRAMLNRREV